MLRLLKKLRRNERGNVLIIAGMAMPLIVGSAGLAVDGIQWALWKRQLQRAADSAALAGVYAKVQGASSQTPQQAIDYELGINADATQRRNATGFALTTANRTISDETGTGFTNGTRVVLSISQVPAFSSMFWPTMQIRAGATAATVATGTYCVVSLIDTGSTGITATGSADINLGCGMITNSTSMSAAIATGTSEVYATPVAAVGGVTASDNWNGAELLPFTVKQDDPFASATVPSSADFAGACTAMSVGPQETISVASPPAGKVTCFSDLRVQGNLTLGPGTYVINGGDINANSGSRLSCTGCTFILTNTDNSSTANIGTVDFNGGAQINISAPETGPYADMLFFQDRRAAPNGVNIINGNSSSTFTGAMYFPKQQLRINGTSDLTFTCAQFVAWTVQFSGDTDIVNTCEDGYGDKKVMGRHVRLVA